MRDKYKLKIRVGQSVRVRLSPNAKDWNTPTAKVVGVSEGIVTLKTKLDGRYQHEEENLQIARYIGGRPKAKKNAKEKRESNEPSIGTTKPELDRQCDWLGDIIDLYEAHDLAGMEKMLADLRKTDAVKHAGKCVYCKRISITELYIQKENKK